MSNFHAQAINLARRFSERNENDLLQENFVEDPSDNSFSEVSEEYCSVFLDRSPRTNNNPTLPKGCERFANIRASLLQRRKTNQEDEAIAFAGMDAGSMIDARRARAHGGLSGAQIRRRMTTQKKGSESTSWFY